MNNDTKNNEIGAVLISTYTDAITIAFKMPVDENSIPKELTQGDVILLRDFLNCFHFHTLQKDNGLLFHLENPVTFDDELKNNILAFIEKYSRSAPHLKAIPSYLEMIPIGAPIFITHLAVRHNQSLMMAMLNQLASLQGMKTLPQEFFDFIEKYNLFSAGHKQHTLIGHKNKGERICRWCGRALATGATFQKKGHAISESIGNKNIILGDECDECNEKFGSTIEEAAATYFSFANTFFGIHGKNGIPKVKSSEYESIENNGSSGIVINASTFEHGADNFPNKISINAPKKIIYQDVYRCFCKYALSCCEDDIFGHFKHLVPWLQKKRDFDRLPLVLVYGHRNIDIETGVAIEQPIMNMYIRRDNDNTMPYLICELHHTIRTHVFIVPQNDGERERFSSRENGIELWRKLPFIKEETWLGFCDMSGTVPQDYQCVINLRMEKGED